MHEYLAKGLSPETVHDFYKQRFRWAAGGLEIFVRNNALFKRGLSGTQRFLYFWSGFNTCLALPMIYLIYCPVFFLLGGGNIRIATFDTYQYFMFFCPYMILQVRMKRSAGQRGGSRLGVGQGSEGSGAWCLRASASTHWCDAKR